MIIQQINVQGMAKRSIDACDPAPRHVKAGVKLMTVAGPGELINIPKFLVSTPRTGNVLGAEARFFDFVLKLHGV